jgi:hypothetical protein
MDGTFVPHSGKNVRAREDAGPPQAGAMYEPL